MIRLRALVYKLLFFKKENNWSRFVLTGCPGADAIAPKVTGFKLLLCTLPFLAACGKKKEEPLTLSDDKMVKILVDVHIVEAALQDVNFRLRDSVKTAFYNQVYEMNDISEDQFVENIEIMNKQPKLISSVYSKVMEELSKLEASD